MYNQGWEGYFGNVSSVIGRRGGLQTQTRELIKSIEIASNLTALTGNGRRRHCAHQKHAKQHNEYF